MKLHEEVADHVSKRRSRLDTEHEIDEWLSLEHFPDDTRVNLTLPGRRFIFQHSRMQKALGPVVSRAQWSRYRSNPEMTIPLSTLRILIENKRELFLTSFTVTTLGNKKSQLPIKLPIKTRSNSFAKFLALLTLSKNVFQTGTYQTDQREKIESFIETFDSVFDVNLCPDGKIAQNQRGYYVKIPTHICSAIVKVFTGEHQASFPQIILSVSNCKDEQDILEFVFEWLKFSRLYRFEGDEKNLYQFRYNDETREIINLIEKLGVQYETASIMDRGVFVPVYLIPNVADNKAILSYPSLVNRLKDKISSQEARIEELEAIKDDLESELEEATGTTEEKLSWSRAIDERLAEDLSEKLVEFERILDYTRSENEKLKGLLRETGTDFDEVKEERIGANEIAQLRTELNQLKDQLANIKQTTSTDKELSYRVTKEFTMKAGSSTVTSDLNLNSLVKVFLSSPDNWILLLLWKDKALSKEEISNALGIPAERRMDLQKRLNDFVDRRILKIVESANDELYQIDNQEMNDLIRAYTHTILGNKTADTLDARHLLRTMKLR